MITSRHAIYLGLMIAVMAGQPAAASSFLDLSQPMTGKSRSVIHFDGTPVEMGAPANAEPSQTSEVEPSEPDDIAPGRHGLIDDGTLDHGAPGAKSNCGPYFGMRPCTSRPTVVVPININQRRATSSRSSVRFRFRRR